MSSVRFVTVLCWCLSSCLRGRCLPYRYELGAFRPVLVWRPFLSVCFGIRSVPFELAMSMYPAYRIRHYNPTLLVSSTSCLSPYLPVLASGGLSHHSVLSLPNQNPRLGSICGETAELEGRELIINTPPHISRHSKRYSLERAVLPRGA